ncbi:hypothetical protein [Dyadobacter chenhuakuii]|uniref:Uncharacterized protein n=1 Tax=Dyadobacter chenhuakuii TaxID=2909339 RepID=A0ABY4XSP5_9BACT|nr:hypothetical protein [Dyadobacter chenhuakuii]MCF2492278.1 hypothetical protein [Dyadobacter chenhuakuii]USJ33415.1 hypothetical protein NFI80_11845 [Dyadobacter chenhuakuii]
MEKLGSLELGSPGFQKESDMKKNSKIFYVPTIPKHVRLRDFDTKLSIDDFDALVEISGVKGKVTKQDVDRLLKSKIGS